MEEFEVVKEKIGVYLCKARGVRGAMEGKWFPKALKELERVRDKGLCQGEAGGIRFEEEIERVTVQILRYLNNLVNFKVSPEQDIQALTGEFEKIELGKSILRNVYLRMNEET